MGKRDLDVKPVFAFTARGKLVLKTEQALLRLEQLSRAARQGALK